MEMIMNDIKHMYLLFFQSITATSLAFVFVTSTPRTVARSLCGSGEGGNIVKETNKERNKPFRG
jgi:hypothetical protein